MKDILKSLLLPVGIVFGIVLIVSGVLKNEVIIYSFLLGAGFSFLGFRQLVRAQALILKTGNSKTAVLFGYFSRLLLYALPLVLTIKRPAYFQFFVVFVALFTFQFLYILLELQKNYRSYRQRKVD